MAPKLESLSWSRDDGHYKAATHKTTISARREWNVGRGRVGAGITYRRRSCFYDREFSDGVLMMSPMGFGGVGFVREVADSDDVPVAQDMGRAMTEFLVTYLHQRGHGVDVGDLEAGIPPYRHPGVATPATGVLSLLRDRRFTDVMQHIVIITAMFSAANAKGRHQGDATSEQLQKTQQSHTFSALPKQWRISIYSLLSFTALLLLILLVTGLRLSSSPDPLSLRIFLFCVLGYGFLLVIVGLGFFALGVWVSDEEELALYASRMALLFVTLGFGVVMTCEIFLAVSK